MRCLWLSGDIPYPTYNGRRLYSAGLCTALAGAGVDVVAYGIDVDGAAPQPSRVDWHHVEPAAPLSPVRKLVGRWPSAAEDRRTVPYQTALDAALQAGGWDVAVIDHLPMCWTLPALRSAGIPVVYASQNHETSLRSAFADHLRWREPTKVPLLLDVRRTRAAERLVVAHSALVTAVTESDAARFRADGARNVLVATPGFSGRVCQERTIDDSTPRVAVLVGSLLWRVKRLNVDRLVEVADPILAAARIELRVVGITPPGYVERSFGALDAVHFTGVVDDVAEELAKARVGIICERDGGGFKLKALDYIFHRVPMIVLDGSMEGVPLTRGVEYCGAVTEQEVAQRIVELVDDPATCQGMQEQAFDRCAGNFEWATRGASLAAALEEVVVRVGSGERAAGVDDRSSAGAIAPPRTGQR